MSIENGIIATGCAKGGAYDPPTPDYAEICKHCNATVDETEIIECAGCERPRCTECATECEECGELHCIHCIKRLIPKYLCGYCVEEAEQL